MSDQPPPTDRLRRLVDLVGRLRGPDGCPWDREQRLEDLRAYLLEEAHETAAAIDSGEADELAGELGDLLFQVAFLVRLGEEAEAFDLDGVVDGIERKMIARHPHVFGEEKLPDADAVRRSWESRKARDVERDRSHLAGVPSSLPALVAAYRMTEKAAGVGFDWPDARSVLHKIEEELGELREALAGAGTPDRDAVREETGDLLFSMANLARHLGVDPEAALAAANRKFRRRFEGVEAALAARGRSLDQATLEEMDALWDEVKSG